MNYQDERTYGCRVSDSWHYRGMKTVIIENKYIRVQIIADKGADISSFIYKPTDTELVFKTPFLILPLKKLQFKTRLATSLLIGD